MRIITTTTLLTAVIDIKAFVLPSTTMCRLDHPSTSSLNMGLIDNILASKTPINKGSTLQVLDEIGSGTYGIVHLTSLQQKDDVASSTMSCVAKRAWTLDELQQKNSDNNNNNGEAKILSDQDLKELSKRCNYYLDVERHCLQKLNDLDSNSQYVPKLLGEYPNEKGRGDWLVFELVEGIINNDKPAKTLADILELDWIDQHNKQQNHHHLYMLQKELGMKEDTTFEDVLDVTLLQLLRTVSHVNGANIVHRDIKPGNLLVTSGGFVLIDFGSAADMDPPSKASVGSAFSSMIGGGGGRVGLDDGVVALSPIYGAPETYIKVHRGPLNFDAFSTALVFCQLLFNLLDERSDASFRGQLEDVDYDLDSWLQREINAELRPDGIEEALSYLANRPGLWSVLRGMLYPNPEQRLSTMDALERVESLLNAVREGGTSILVGNKELDGKFFAGVLESLESCELPDDGTAIGVLPLEKVADVASTEPSMSSVAEQAFVTPYPLHYVATFSRSKPLGLILSEVDPSGNYEDKLGAEDKKLWMDATASAQPGEVYVRGVIEGGQAEGMGIGLFQVGDRIMGVGESPFVAEGFDTVVELLQRQPPNAKSVTLHFDRKSRGRSHSYERAAPHTAKVVGHGAWSACGRRKAQEDRFILHEIHDSNNAALLAGVFDGHGGSAAAKSLSQLIPSLFSVELAGLLTDGKVKATSVDLRNAMGKSYDTSCQTYRNGCDDLETCVADYDPREGIILATMGANDVIAGSTTSMAVMSVSEDGADELSVLNCGDSRTLVIGKPRGGSASDSVVHFSTRDHSPNCEIEIERLSLGKDRGYSQPMCRMGRWRIKVGDFTYGLARSLEGSFTTSKGIVSDPDISAIDLTDMVAERENCCIVLATDGLFEVIDNEECGRDVIKLREEGLDASEAAKQLCRMAVEKGSPDNVSVVVIYVD
jgi:serine/threonine protein phosphatase PrpC/serine/threonine protein kinase